MPIKEDRRRFDKILRARKQLAGMQVTVGIHESAGGHDESDLSIAQIAALHEYGAREGLIPERSFMRSTIDGQKGEILGDMRDVADQALQGRDPRKAADRLGFTTSARIKQTIRDGIDPPLSEWTLFFRKEKGSSGANEKPLIDTGQMIGSIDHEVRGA